MYTRRVDRYNYNDIIPVPSSEVRLELEKMGVRCGESYEGDDHSLYAYLPFGWKRESVAGSKTSFIVDREGQRRVKVVYDNPFLMGDPRISISVVPVVEEVPA